jgi:hypothetical protein
VLPWDNKAYINVFSLVTKYRDTHPHNKEINYIFIIKQLSDHPNVISEQKINESQDNLRARLQKLKKKTICGKVMNVPQPWKTISRTSHGPMNLLGRARKNNLQ